MKKGKMNVIVGAQAGSEAKGKMAAFLAHKFGPDIICMAASPNAGHTAYKEKDGEQVKMVSYHLPISAMFCDAAVLLGPSSVIHVRSFMEEMEKLGVPERRVMIHPRAALITDADKEREKQCGLLKIGSTAQGVGIVRRNKLMREEFMLFASDDAFLKRMLGDTVTEANGRLNKGATGMVEMTQGFDLDLEHGIDPHYCTSKMINPSMGLAEAGISPNRVGDIYGVFRPYPIRVNNREGSSGPYAEAEEIDWNTVGRRCRAPHDISEITTTTKLLRRVFEFSHVRYEHFIRVANPDYMCLQFANYIEWRAYKVREESELPERVTSFVEGLETFGRVPIAYIGTSPYHMDMVDRGIDS